LLVTLFWDLGAVWFGQGSGNGNDIRYRRYSLQCNGKHHLFGCIWWLFSSR